MIKAVQNDTSGAMGSMELGVQEVEGKVAPIGPSGPLLPATRKIPAARLPRSGGSGCPENFWEE